MKTPPNDHMKSTCHTALIRFQLEKTFSNLNGNELLKSIHYLLICLYVEGRLIHVIKKPENLGSLHRTILMKTEPISLEKTYPSATESNIL